MSLFSPHDRPGKSDTVRPFVYCRHSLVTTREMMNWYFVIQFRRPLVDSAFQPLEAPVPKVSARYQLEVHLYEQPTLFYRDSLTLSPRPVLPIDSVFWESLKSVYPLNVSPFEHCKKFNLWAAQCTYTAFGHVATAAPRYLPAILPALRSASQSFEDLLCNSSSQDKINKFFSNCTTKRSTIGSCSLFEQSAASSVQLWLPQVSAS